VTDTTVRAGQVWQSKNMGQRLTVVRETESEDRHWIVSDSKGAEWEIPEWRLTDDYVLVKDAP
jgi:hypothetical protein